MPAMEKGLMALQASAILRGVIRAACVTQHTIPATIRFRFVRNVGASGPEMNEGRRIRRYRMALTQMQLIQSLGEALGSF